LEKVIALIAVGLYLVVWLISLGQLLKNKGFDPSLATYADPLRLNNFLGYRFFLAAGIVTCAFGYVICQILAAVLIFASLLQLVLLFAFERQKTQPTLYYLLALLVGVLVLTASFYGALAGLVLVGVQERHRAAWQRRQKQIYDSWVADCAKKIDRRYKRLANKMKPGDWFWVLHIATTESIARPNIVRQAEKIYYLVKKPSVISTGIMQVAAAAPLTDKQSMQEGARAVVKALGIMPANIKNRNEQMAWMSSAYNGSTKYRVYLEATYPGLRQAWEDIMRGRS
jgi:hypothetical protein